MNCKDAAVALTDRERQLIERVAAERGVTFEEAADQLVHEAIADKFKRRLGRVPAQVYTIKRNS